MAKLVKGDIWDFDGYKIITTNFSVNKNGEAVMGRGLAYQAAQKFPALKKEYGKILSEQMFTYTTIFQEYKLIMFPVKRYWYEKADINIILASLKELVDLEQRLKEQIYMPIPGVGYGELNKELVLQLITAYLDLVGSNIIVVERGDNVKQKYKDSFKPSVRSDRS